MLALRASSPNDPQYRHPQYSNNQQRRTAISKTSKKTAAPKTGKAGRFSWLRLAAPTKPEPALRELQQQSQERLGYVRNFLKLPFGPGRLALYQGYLDKLMRGPDGELPPLERELMALIASVENRCEVCILSHGGALKKTAWTRIWSTHCASPGVAPN